MAPKTKQSDRAEILLRMASKQKERIVGAAKRNGVSVNGWLNYGIGRLLALHDAEVAVDEKMADIERRLATKFEEIVTALAGGDLALSARERVDFQAAADIALSKWRNHAATFFHAKPRTLLERLCLEHGDLEAELEDVQQLDTFADESLDADGDEPVSTDPDDVVEPDAGDESDAAGGE
jgi:hypothetical protein